MKYNLKKSQIYHLRGRITSKKEITHYAGRMKHQSQYELVVDISQKTKPSIFDGTIQAMRENVLDDKVWDDIITDAWQGKRYIFRCIKHGYKYKLVGWKDVQNKATEAMVKNVEKAREIKKTDKELIRELQEENTKWREKYNFLSGMNIGKMGNLEREIFDKDKTLIGYEKRLKNIAQEVRSDLMAKYGLEISLLRQKLKEVYGIVFNITQKTGVKTAWLPSSDGLLLSEILKEARKELKPGEIMVSPQDKVISCGSCEKINEKLKEAVEKMKEARETFKHKHGVYPEQLEKNEYE